MKFQGGTGGYQKDEDYPQYEGYSTKDIYDAISDGDGEKVYLSGGVYLDKNWEWAD